MVLPQDPSTDQRARHASACRRVRLDRMTKEREELSRGPVAQWLLDHGLGQHAYAFASTRARSR